MLRFILSDFPVNVKIDDNEETMWKVRLVNPQPPKTIAGFIGSDDDEYLDKDIAPLLAGDYVEFLNEKYLDKEINAEWPPQDKELYLKYHLERALKYATDLNYNNIKKVLLFLIKSLKKDEVKVI